MFCETFGVISRKELSSGCTSIEKKLSKIAKVNDEIATDKQELRPGFS